MGERRDCGRTGYGLQSEAMKLRILLLLLVPPILLFSCALIMMWIPLPHPFPPALSGGRNLISAIVTGFLGAGYIVGLAIYVVSSFLRAGRILDPVLTPAGLVSESYMIFGRQYHGVIEERVVEVNFVPSQAVWPDQLNVRVSADLGTRVAIGQQRPLLDCRDCGRLEVAGAELGGLQVYAQEEGSARRLLADPGSRGVLARLLDDQKRLGFREVYLQPDKVWLRAHPRGMTAGRFQQWFDDLLALAEAGEKALAGPR